jgi:hypothetical protein
MKKLLYLACLLGLISAGGCKKEAEEPANLATLDGQSYALKKGLAFDYGAFEDSHHNFDFFITDDADLSVNSEQVNGKILIYLELFSAGEAGFKTGTFTYNSSSNIDEQSFFSYADVSVDTNNDGILDFEEGLMEVIGGSVTVSGSSPDFTISYDLLLPNNKNLLGSYSGTYEYIDRSASSFADEGERVSKKRLF